MTVKSRFWLPSILPLVWGCAGPAPSGPPGVDAGWTDALAVGAVTVAPARVRAGDRLSIQCRLVDADGVELEPSTSEPVIGLEPRGSAVPSDGGFVATRTGELAVACAFPELGLRDESPERVIVEPGPLVTVAAELDRRSVRAGESVAVSCTGADAYGNVVAVSDPSIGAVPAHPRNVFHDASGIFEKSGVFEIGCGVAGATNRAATLEVSPELPAAIAASLAPEQPFQFVGKTIQVVAVVTDKFGNVIEDAPVALTTDDGDAESLGHGRLRFSTEGVYTLRATVTGPTEGGALLQRDFEVAVDGGGPVIDCEPANGTFVSAPPVGVLEFEGRVADPADVVSVTVNGSPVAIDAAGRFQKDIITRFGVNFVDVSARDGNGLESSRVCSFLVANTWAPPNGGLDHAIPIQLRQSAVDDDGPSGASASSLADVLDIIVNSNGLNSILHDALVEANPLHERVTYRGGAHFPGAENVKLRLIDGGLALIIDVERVDAYLRVDTPIGDEDGWLTLHDIHIAAHLDVGISAGRLAASIRTNPPVVVTIDDWSSNFEGVTVDTLLHLYDITGILEDRLRPLVQYRVGPILADFLKSLDIRTVATSFSVPSLDRGPIPISFSSSLKHVSVTPERLYLTFSSMIGADAVEPVRHTLGTPIPINGPMFVGLGTDPIAAGVHVGVVNQALHTLWRAGFFDATLSSANVPGMPAEASVAVATLLPPVATVSSFGANSGRASLAIGGMQVSLTHPGLFEEPIALDVGVRATMRVTQVGSRFLFDQFDIEELHLGSSDVALDAESRSVVEGLLDRVLSRVIDGALNDALPAIPIPSFTFGSSLAAFNVPPGSTLGLGFPQFQVRTDHLTFSGSVRLQSPIQ